MRNIFILFLLNLSLFAYVENFNIYSEGTKNSDLNDSGITFSSDGRWIVFSMPFSVFDTPVLLEPSSSKDNAPLTLTFKQTQCFASLEFATDGEDAVDVIGMYNGEETFHQQFKGNDRGGSFVGNFQINTKLDSIKIYTVDKKRLLIDNIETSQCTLNNYNQSQSIIAQYSFEQNTSLSAKGVIGNSLIINRELKLGKYENVESFALWIKPENIDNQSTIIQSVSEDSNARMKVSINEDAYLQIDFQDAFFSPFVSDIKIQKDKWTYLCITRDKENLNIYINGNLHGSYIVASKLNLTGESFVIGEDYFGMVDEIRLYNKEITPKQALELYNTRENFTQSHNESFEEGKQFCINNPQECGLKSATTKEDISIAKDIEILQGNSFDIQWHLWTADGNTYLVSGDSNSSSIWQLVPDTRQWKPVHNAGAYDGFEAQGTIFDSITISDDASQITFSNELNTTEEN
jgi:hypothetical protein